MKNKLDLIIRGFLYKENWLPLSSRRKRTRPYTIDFLKYSNYYKNLITSLEKKYIINLFFTTYDTTPNNYIKQVSDLFNPANIFLSPELNSTQFTTTNTALSSPDMSNSSIKMIIRSDILMTQYFVDTILAKSDLNKNILYVLCKESVDLNKVIDVLHLFYGDDVFSSVKNYFSIPRKHAHYIHKSIYTKTLKNNDTHKCKQTENCTEFFSIFEGKI